MSEVTRHFTATTFVVHEGRVLLHCHAKQKLWLPPGGHIERDELPHEAAVREIEEETGLRLRLHSEGEAEGLAAEMACSVVPQPAFILVEDINPFHQHIDFIYYARLYGEIAEERHGWERSGFRWFRPDELANESGVPMNVIAGARRAIAHFGGDVKAS
jgi:8-oxo-dGTP pyrophosphatase MutT (NUDIX family)